MSALRGPVVPYVTTWSAEQTLVSHVVEHPSGIGIAYADEILGDRDSNGVLWHRTPSLPGQGKPEFGLVHSSRQRRAMRKFLCQVCAGPATPTDDGGLLWLLKDHRHDWAGWPTGMGVTEPPTCRSCAHSAAQSCPALRQGYVMVRVRLSLVSGVHGVRYRPGRPFPTPIESTLVRFDDPVIHWTLASKLVREFVECTIEDIR
ncbi:Phage protein [Alloactinosynnema sp. L-07]|uniref:hypothetical protein n=1 Tax=Alloactinosynnema sp. L-07 TaxID=1653480 RepID=UPI00065EFD6A|nr:hypothetical protein [Alloactinosynnema sp. L-07]CRK60026.1 Phage protein [Alloactinosynnema sp. L-07]